MTTSADRPRNARGEPRSAAVADSPVPPATAPASKGERPPKSRGNTRVAAGGSAAAATPAKGVASASRWAKLARAASFARVALGAVFVIVAALGVAWGARRYLVSSPRFALRTLSVEGNARLSAQEVADRGGLKLGDNVFALDLAKVEATLANDPWIASAKLQRKLPGSVVVRVTEHEPAAVVSIGDKLYLVARTGRVFKEVEPGDPLDLPVVTGLAPSDVAKDREGVEREVLRALDVIDELGKSNVGQRFPVQEIHLEKDGGLSAIVGRDGISLQLGKPPFRGKLEQAARVFDELGKRKTDPSIIFLDNEGSPERVVVRLR